MIVELITSSLLPLQPPSCMVAPIREIGNITSSTSVLWFTTLNIFPTNDVNMVIDSIDNFFEKNCDNYDKVRDHSLVSSIYCPRTLSLSSSNYDKDYATRVQKESDRMVKDNSAALSDSP